MMSGGVRESPRSIHTHTAGVSLACGCHLQARTCISPHQLQRAKETWLSRLPTLICTPAVVPPRVERASRSAQAVFRTHDAAFASARGKDATDAGDGASGDLHKRSSTLTSDCTPSTQPSWEGGSQTYSRTLRFAGYSYSTRHPTLIRSGDRPLTFATKNQSVINRGRTLVSCLVGSITQSISLSSDHYIHPFVLQQLQPPRAQWKGTIRHHHHLAARDITRTTHPTSIPKPRPLNELGSVPPYPRSNHTHPSASPLSAPPSPPSRVPLTALLALSATRRRSHRSPRPTSAAARPDIAYLSIHRATASPWY